MHKRKDLCFSNAAVLHRRQPASPGRAGMHLSEPTNLETQGTTETTAFGSWSLATLLQGMSNGTDRAKAKI